MTSEARWLVHCIARHPRWLTFGLLLQVQRFTRIPLALRPCRDPDCGDFDLHSAHLTPLAKAALGSHWQGGCP